MPRYHFNIRNGFGFILDEEGLELSSVRDARMQAISGARSLICAEVLEGRLDLHGQIEVTGDNNVEVLTVRFRDAVDVYEGNPPPAANR